MKLYTPSFATSTMQIHCNKHFATPSTEDSIPDADTTHFAPAMQGTYYGPHNGEGAWLPAETPGGSPMILRQYHGVALSGLSSSMDPSLYAADHQYLAPKPHHPYQMPPYQLIDHERMGGMFAHGPQFLDQDQRYLFCTVPPLDSPSPHEESDEESSRTTPPPQDFPEEDESSQNRPYAQLIHEALMSKADKQMVLNEIYDYFRQRWPKFRSSKGKGWMNSIRHNLSMNGAFEKIERPEGDTGKGYIWKLTESAIRQGVKSTTRYRKQGSNGAKKRARESSPSDCSPKRPRRDSRDDGASDCATTKSRRASDLSDGSSSQSSNNSEPLTCVLNVPTTMDVDMVGIHHDEAFYDRKVDYHPIYTQHTQFMPVKPEPCHFSYGLDSMPGYALGHMGYINNSMVPLGHGPVDEYGAMEIPGEESSFCDQFEMLDKSI